MSLHMKTLELSVNGKLSFLLQVFFKFRTIYIYVCVCNKCNLKLDQCNIPSLHSTWHFLFLNNYSSIEPWTPSKQVMNLVGSQAPSPIRNVWFNRINSYDMTFMSFRNWTFIKCELIGLQLFVFSYSTMQYFEIRISFKEMGYKLYFLNPQKYFGNLYYSK